MGMVARFSGPWGIALEMKDQENRSIMETGWLIKSVESRFLQFDLFIATLLAVGGTAAAPLASLAGRPGGCRRVLSTIPNVSSVGLS
jgi:hypothetical protein